MNGICIAICYLLVAVFVIGTSYAAYMTFKEACSDCGLYIKRLLVMVRRMRIAASPLVVKCAFVAAAFAGVVAKVIKSQL